MANDLCSAELLNAMQSAAMMFARLTLSWPQQDDLPANVCNLSHNLLFADGGLTARLPSAERAAAVFAAAVFTAPQCVARGDPAAARDSSDTFPAARMNRSRSAAQT